MIVELKGSVKKLFAENQVTDNFSKREFVLTIDEDSKYSQDIIIQATNTKIDLLKNIVVGNKVIAKCSLKGNEAKDGRYYVQLNLWEIENKTAQG